MHRSWSMTVGVAGLATLAASCGGGDDRVIVFAASSLTDVFDRLEREFEAANPDVDVVVNTAGSSSLVAQLADGAPVDVLVTADRRTMEQAVVTVAADALPVDLARNDLVIAVERGNPLGIAGIDDLADGGDGGDGPVVVLAAPEVPAGDYAMSALRCAGVEIAPASYEQSVRAVASKVALGEADAGLVYRTDVGDRLEAVELPADCQVRAEYPLLTVTDDDTVRRFVEFVTGAPGVDALVDAGFGLP